MNTSLSPTMSCVKPVELPMHLNASKDLLIFIRLGNGEVSLADYSATRFVGKADRDADDFLDAMQHMQKRPLLFAAWRGSTDVTESEFYSRMRCSTDFYVEFRAAMQARVISGSVKKANEYKPLGSGTTVTRDSAAPAVPILDIMGAVVVDEPSTTELVDSFARASITHGIDAIDIVSMPTTTTTN